MTIPARSERRPDGSNCQTDGLPEDRPRRLLQVGYNTLDEIYEKGIARDDLPETFEVALNFGRYFDESHLFIPFGKVDLRRRLTDTIIYHERRFAHRRSRLRLVHALVHLIKSARELRRMAETCKPDVIQVCGPHLPNAVYMLSGLRSRYATTCFLEAFWEDILDAQASIPGFIKRILPSYYRLTYRFYNVFFGAPSLDKSYYAKRGMSPDNISDWQQLVDIRLIDAAQRISEPQGLDGLPRPRIVTVGRLHAEKCCLDAIEVLKQVRDAGVDAGLVLVGDGPQREEAEALIASYGLEGKVAITGQIPIIEALSVVWRSDICFAPMQGSALLEAQATGRPVIAYDHETHRALIDQGRTGLLVEHRNTRKAAEAIIDLIRDEKRAERLGNETRAHCEKILDPIPLAIRINDGAYQAYHRFRDD